MTLWRVQKLENYIVWRIVLHDSVFSGDSNSKDFLPESAFVSSCSFFFTWYRLANFVSGILYDILISYIVEKFNR